jgi:hypothetical protein
VGVSLGVNVKVAVGVAVSVGTGVSVGGIAVEVGEGARDAQDDSNPTANNIKAILNQIFFRLSMLSPVILK